MSRRSTSSSSPSPLHRPDRTHAVRPAPARSRAPAGARLLLALPLVLAGCVAGSDPALDPRLDEPEAGSSAPESTMYALERMNAYSLTSTRWQIALVDPCTLRVEARVADGDTEVRLVDLLAIDVQVKGNLGRSLQAVQVDRSGHPVLDREHLFEAERWTEAVEYASHVKSLQRACAARG